MPTAEFHAGPVLHHVALHTVFTGIEHPVSTPEARIHQYRGIKYASVPARFRQSKLFTSFPPVADASKYGPICPQVHYHKTSEEDLFGLAQADIPPQPALKQNEFECLNLNITCPTGLTPQSRVPVMVWIHGGGDRGSGSSWVYDGGNFVKSSILIGKPIIMVTINFRLGLFGFAASPALRDDNKLAGDEGVGNYGLRDQRRALEWIHHFIADFGGDPSNITLAGASTGGADVICHLLSEMNEAHPVFHRAIVQSAIIDHNLPDVGAAGWHLSRIMSMLRVSSVDQLRALDADKLVALGSTLRATDDGFFFRKHWQECISPEGPHKHHHHAVDAHPPPAPRRTSRSVSVARTPARAAPKLQLPAHLQPLLIGDCAADALLWARAAALWTPAGVVRRLKAVCQSLTKASALLQAYDISAYTPDAELVECVLDLVSDARVAWPTECVAQGARRERGGRGVWRYVFDQEGPLRGAPHHAADILYLFDNAPLPPACLPGGAPAPAADAWCDGPFDDSDDDSDDLPCAGGALRGTVEDAEWLVPPPVDAWSYARVRDALQGRWLAFAHGEAPWAEDKVFVFGPEGETGERSACIFEGRRRAGVWRAALAPLGMALVQKVGLELSRGPPLGGEKPRF